MNNEELLHHLSVIKDFAPFNDGMFQIWVLLSISAVLGVGTIIVGWVCGGNEIPIDKRTRVASFGIAIGIVSLMMIVLVSFEYMVKDNHEVWQQVEGYTSISELANFLNHLDLGEKITCQYVTILVSGGDSWITESKKLKKKLADGGVAH